MKRNVDDRNLSPEQFCALLAQLGWKQSDFSRRTGLTPQTVARWATGKAPLPLWAGEYLGALCDLQTLHTKYLAPTRAKPDPLAQVVGE